jgi:hypothetical protein
MALHKTLDKEEPPPLDNYTRVTFSVSDASSGGSCTWWPAVAEVPAVEFHFREDVSLGSCHRHRVNVILPSGSTLQNVFNVSPKCSAIKASPSASYGHWPYEQV